ncbi:MAG: glycosyltransferase family 1 protein [Patescibacteria group bacterium]|nr:glycosyltransferase family 4 protein [Patescibacteria group bacterium]
MTPKRIVFDARMYGLKHAGIGRYVANLLSAIKKINPPHFSFTLLSTKDLASQLNKNFGSCFDLITVEAKHYSLKEQWLVPSVLSKLNPDLVHFPHFNSPLLYRGKFVVTIHDLIKHYFRGKQTTTKSPFFYWPKYFGYRAQVAFSLRHSSHIFVPSFFWKKKLVSDFGIDPQKITVTYEAVDPEFLNLTHRSGEDKFQGEFFQNPFLIYTGSVYPHKNLAIVLEALKKMTGINLAVVCSRSVFTERMEDLVKRFNLEKRVKFLGFVEDRNLVPLYRKATALIQPSLMEGFGLTGLEAMATGCPVVSSDSSCLPEVYGQAALYFNPKDVADLSGKVKLLLAKSCLKKRLTAQGKKQVAKYSWSKTAEETLATYQKVLG